MSDSEVLCYGGISIESILELPYEPKPGIAHIICKEHFRIGGGAANVSEWLGSWRIPVRLSGYAIGHDSSGDRLLNWLREYPSIDLSYIKRQKKFDTLFARSIPFPDGNSYLFCSDFANAPIVAPEPELLDGIKILEIAFYYANPRMNTAAAQLAKLAHTKGIQIVAMDVVSPEHETLPISDVIIKSAASIQEQFPDVDIMQHSINLQSISKGIVITTDGNNKVQAIGDDGKHYSLVPPKVQSTDNTGAGDSFRAGIIYGLLQKWSLDRCLQWATAVGALQVQRSMAQDQPPSFERIASLAEQIVVQHS